MGSDDSISLGLENIWKSWLNFKRGKRMTGELHEFQFYLEKNLSELQAELESGTYQHGSYRQFTVCDNKRREISCAGIRDRVVHRLIYDYLVPIFDKTFSHDAWSCRKGKGLIGAIERAQEFLRKNPRAYIWRADVRKFFDSVDQPTLMKLIERRISDPRALRLIKEVVGSFPEVQRERESL
jgi:retron-type reverse transcriptase